VRLTCELENRKERFEKREEEYRKIIERLKLERDSKITISDD